jgi:hypothetical protein
VTHARRADRRAWRAGVRQDRRGGLRGHGAGRTVPASTGAVLRVHHDPARRGPAVPRSASLAWVLRLRRGVG